MDCSTPGFPARHYLPELAQTHAHRVGDAIPPTHPLSPPSPLGDAIGIYHIPIRYQAFSLCKTVLHIQTIY